jgi:hypothetical protein
MEEVKRCFSFTFQWPPSLEHSIDHQALDPSNGHQAWNILLVTKLWILPLATKLWILLSPSFSFSLKSGLG